ncbi:MAG: hypothetical protein HFH41_07245 [Lachnospiraceae bacterium]|nr:hypothetical protein [Lachnospiraceae bacterium]
MREIGILIGYEYKKILQRRSSWISLGVVLILVIFGGIAGVIGDYYMDGKRIGSNYDLVRQERKELESLTGRRLDEKLFPEVQEELNVSVLCMMIQREIGSRVKIDGENFYKCREKMLASNYQREKLSAGEIEFHKKEEKKIETPYLYGNMMGFERYFSIQSVNGICLSFALAICFAPMFAGEYASRMDAFVLTTRFGKNKLIAAKFLTGLSFAVFSELLVLGISLLEIGIFYGLSGWNLPIQVSTTGFYFSLPINLLEMLGITAGCSIMALCMTVFFVMFCSVKIKSSFGVIILNFIFIFLPEPLLLMVAEKRWLFMLVNSMPASMMEARAPMADQLFTMGNRHFYFYQLIPVVYLFLMAGLAWRTYRSFHDRVIV